MKFQSTKNFGYGRSMPYAIKNILADHYGGHFGTQRTHASRLNDFVKFVKVQGIRDLRSISAQHVDAYAEHLHQLCDESKLQVSTAQNRLSSLNVLMSFVTKGAWRAISPSKRVGRRSYVRTQEPQGLFPWQYEPALERLTHQGEWALALQVGLCRLIGARFREASLLDLGLALREAERDGTITIRRGSKGGRAKKIPRVIQASDKLITLLGDGVRHVDSRCLVPDSQRFIQWYDRAHREWRKLAPALGLSTRFHELRAGFACERYEYLTGEKAPCVSHRGASHEVLPESECLSDGEAREVIAQEMGHNRVEIINSYCGRFA